MGRWTLTALFAVFFFVWHASAWAADPCAELSDNVEYQVLVAKGVEKVKAGDYEDAFREFTKAQKICPFDPGVTYYMARAKHLAGECETALFLYDQTEANITAGLVASALTTEALNEKRGQAQACIDASSASTPVTIRCADQGVRLAITSPAGVREVACPFDGEATGSPLEVVASAEGFEPYSASVEAKPGTAVVLDVPSLTPVAGDAPPKVVEDGGGMAVAGWVAVGGGGALLATGAVAAYLASSLRAEVRDAESVDRFGHDVVTEMTRADALDKVEQAEMWDLVAWGGLGVGAGDAAQAAQLLHQYETGDAERVMTGG